MSLGDVFKKLFTRPVKTTGAAPSAGVGGAGGAGESVPFEGDYSDEAWIAGESIPQLAELRGALWKYGAEARASATLPIDPKFWPDGRIRFDHEFSMAQNTQGLRHRQVVQISRRIQQHGERLGDLAHRIASALHYLKDADHEAANVVRQWRRVYDDVQRDEGEFNKYSRLRSKYGHFMTKLVLIPIFILAETALTVIVFKSFMGGEHADNTDRAVALLVSIGIVVGLVAIPHYTAVALKEGLTRRHKFELEAYRRFGLEPSDHLVRKDHVEQVEDRGSRWIAVGVVVMLALLIWPLAHLRAVEFNNGPIIEANSKLIKAQVALDGAKEDLASATAEAAAARKTADEADDSLAIQERAQASQAMRQAMGDEQAAKAELNRIEQSNEGGSWLMFFFLFQVVISAFFFLLEWVNHGESARHLKDLDKEKARALAERARRQDALVPLLADFDFEAQAQVHLIRSAPHYDQQLVSDYHKVIRELRELIRREHPDLAVFLHFAPFPRLPLDVEQEVDEADELGYLAVPISVENPSLDVDDDFDVRFSIRRAIVSILERRPAEVEDNDGDATLSDEWLMVGNPYAQLYQTLARWGFKEPFYARPSELDDVLDIEVNPLDEIFKLNSDRVMDRLREEGDVVGTEPDPEPSPEPAEDDDVTAAESDDEDPPNLRSI